MKIFKEFLISVLVINFNFLVFCCEIVSFHGDLRRDVRRHDSNNAAQYDVKMTLYCRTICPKATRNMTSDTSPYFASASSHRLKRSRLDIDGNNKCILL